MNTDHNELTTNLVQNDLFGNRVQGKTPKKACPVFSSELKECEENGHEKIEPRQRPNYATMPVTTRMYCRADLAAVYVTPPDGEHATISTLTVLPGLEHGREPGEYNLITADVYATLRRQIDTLDLDAIPDVDRDVLISRWESIAAWALAEGWLG